MCVASCLWAQINTLSYLKEEAWISSSPFGLELGSSESVNRLMVYCKKRTRVPVVGGHEQRISTIHQKPVTMLVYLTAGVVVDIWLIYRVLIMC